MEAILLEKHRSARRNASTTFRNAANAATAATAAAAAAAATVAAVDVRVADFFTGANVPSRSDCKAQ
jgi:3-mercaptopyruvate sulfurtransferase SseA